MSTPALLAASALLVSLQASAIDLYWDVNGSTAGLGGTGAWNLTNLFWGLSSDGATGPYSTWDNLALDTAIFSGAAGTVTLTAPMTVQSIIFATSGYTITGSTLTLGGVNPQISHGAAAQATINSVLAGSNGLIINGGSTNGYVLLGASNTLTGGITLNSGGRLVAGGSNSLNGASNVVTVNNGGALQINHSNAFGGNTSAANLVLNDGASLWLGNQNLTHDITANGGTVVIEDRFGGGSSTWTGNLILTADTTLLVTNTGNNDNTIFAGNLTDTGTNRLSLVLNEGCCLDSSLYLSGSNSFTGGITVHAGQLLLTGNDAAAAAAGNVVTINGGIVRASANAFGGDTDAAQLIINNGGRLRVETNHTLNHDVTLTGGTAFIDGLGSATWNGTAVLTTDTLLLLGVAGHSLNVTGNLSDNGAVLSLQTAGNNQRFMGDLSFSGDLIVGGVNTWFDGGNYTYSGDTIITTDARLLLNSTSLSPNSNIRFEGLNNGHATVIYGTSARPSITLANSLGGGELRWNGTGGFYALSSQSDVTVNLGGAGAMLTWNDGLFVPDGHALILGTNTTGGDARQLDFQNGIDLSGGLRQVRADNGNIADHSLLSGQLTGAGGLHVVGNGALELTHTGNNYSGATVVGDAATNTWGNLILNTAGTLSSNSNLQINGVGTSSLVQHGGYVLLTAASGDFTRSLGTGANEVQWTASGGFGAIGAPRTVNIGSAGATLTWGSGGFVPTGHALRFGGNYANSTINWQNGIDLGALDRVINVNEGQGAGHVSTSALEVSLNGVIQGTGGLILNGAGDVALNALNSYGGTTWIGGTSVSGHGDGQWVWANTLANTGTASSLGAGSTVVFGAHNGGLIYTGGATSTDRALALNRTNGAVHYLFNYGSGALTWSGDVTTTGSGQNTLRLGGTYVTSDANGDGIADAPNVISGVISDGVGVTQVQGSTGPNCAAGNVWRLTGANTFTGGLNPLGCTFEVTTLGTAGTASSVGAGSLLADFRSGDGTLRYVGSGESTDRSFWAWGNSRIESSGTGPLALTNTGMVVSQNGGLTHWLGGSNTGDNTLAATLVDGPAPVEFTTSWFRLGKDGPGLWALVTDNNAQANAYSHNTIINGGALRVDNAGAITGGLGVTSSHGATGSSQRSSMILFQGAADGTAGVLGLTAASGGFFRGLTAAGQSFVNNNGTTPGVDPDGAGPLPPYDIAALDDDNYIQGVRWTHSGGFAAWDGTQVVNLFGDGRELTWGTGGFVPTNQQLVFGYETADGTVDFRNGINLGGAARTVHVNDGLAARDAVMSGVLRSTTVLGGLTKTGAGVLTLTANNTYTGVTNVSAGTLEIGNGGTTGTLGSGAQAVIAAGATLVANRSNTYTLSQNIIGDGTLIQRGTGITTMTTNSDIDRVVIEQGTLVTPSSLRTDDVTFTDAGGATLRVTGTLETNLGTATHFTGGLLNDTIVVGAGGTVRATGGLGDGADTLDVAGTLNTGAGSFDLGNGDDTFTVRDNTSLVGTVLGGTGIDTLNANIAGTATLGRLQTFETLAKSGAGVLNVVGPPISDFATVNVNAGTLNVAAGGEIAAAAAGTLTTTIATGATLRVDGAFGCGTASDSITVSGSIVGAGTIDQCGGDDVLTLNDAADVSSFTGTFSGGAHTLGDTVNLNATGTLNFAADIVTNYERLSKTNTGTATLNGTHTYVGGTTIDGGTLDVNGTLETPTIAVADGTTLNVDGQVRATGPTQTMITGSAGANTIVVAGGASLLASGDLGDGADVLDVGGTLDTAAGALLLGAGNDMLTIRDNTTISGTVDGGAGIDTLNANIAGTATLGRIQTFETLAKSGAGVLNVVGPPVSDFANVAVNAGTLNVGVGGEIAAAAGGTLTTMIAAGATLRVDGAFGCGTASDSITVSGNIVGAGTIDQCGGDDTLRLTDTADLSGFVGAIDGGANAAGDTVVLDATSALTLAAGTVTNYESLRKDGAGTATLVGAQVFTAGTAVDGGTLQVNDLLETPTLVLGDGTNLSIDGTVQAVGAGQVTLTGSSGINAVVVNAGAMLLASGDLGDGSDTLDVAGTLDTAASLNLGAGDDTFIVHDGTSVLGTVIGGAGLDTRVYDIAGVANVGALQEFEGLTKRNTGTLNINGPAATTDLQVVDVEGGTLNVGAAASVLSVNTTSVRSGATLRVDGLHTGTSGNDTFNVAGAVSGAGSITLDAGDDTLILSDGADLSGLANDLDGGSHVSGDTVVLNFSGSYSFDGAAVTNFENLTKQNSGTATLTGNHVYAAVSILGGTLDVDASLTTATLALADGTTLNVDGTVQAAGATPTAISGTGGINTLIVAAGATLRTNGDLGDGDDVLDVAGTLDTDGGTLFLGAGDDTFVVHDTTVVTGALDAGAGNDELNVNVSLGSLVPLGSTAGFESLGKSGAGALRIDGPSSFVSVDVEAGVLEVAAGGSVAATTAEVLAGATLDVGGSFTFTAGADTFTVAGAVTGLGTIDMLDGDDQLTVRDGADLSGLATSLSGGAGNDNLVVDVLGSATLGGVTAFETLTKANTGTLHIDGAAPSDFTSVAVNGGLLSIGAAGSVSGVTSTTVASGATLDVAGSYLFSAGTDTFAIAGSVSGLGVIDMLDGDDALTLLDGADLDGLATPLSGGAGNDTVTVDITGSATLGGVSAFETLTKRSSGTLHIDGAAPSDLTAINVNGGVLSVGPAGSVSGVRTTMVAVGTALNVTGVYQGSAAADLFETSGTVVGSVDLLDGDDLVRVHADVADVGGATFDGGVGTDTLAYAHDTNRTFPNGAFASFESLRKEGTGTLTIAGTLDAFSQSVAVAAGTVDLQNATVQTAQFTIEQPATVFGVGTLSGGLTNAGLLAPGHSPGTLTIGGDYTQTATGVLVSEISRAGHDRLEVTGTAALAGTQRLEIEYGYYLAGTTHTLIAAAGGISGDFTTVEANTSALLPYERRVNATSETITFTLRPTASVTTADSNRGRFATWLDGQIAGGLVTPELETYLDTLIQQTTDAQVEELLGELADPPASTTQGSASMIASSFAGSVLDRFAAEGAHCALVSVASEALNCGWTAGLRQWGGADGDAFGPQHDWTIDGTQVGFERRLANGWSVGVTFGYGSADIHDANDSYAQLRAPTGGFYAQFSGERLSASVIALYSDIDNDVTRRATVGSEVRRANASFGNGTIGAGTRLDWRFGGETSPLVQPYLEAFYDRVGGASFTESGAATNLTVDALAREGLRGTLGVLVADDYEGYGHVFRPSLQVGVVHQFLDTYSEMDVRLGGQMPLRVRGVALERTSLELKAELAVSLGRSASLSVGYGGELAENFEQHQLNARVQVAW